MKAVIYIGAFFLFLLPGIVPAGERYSLPPPPPPPPPPAPIVTQINTITEIDFDDLADYVAKGAACDASFYFGTSKPQLDISVAIYNGAEAVCIQGGWKPKGGNVLFKAGWIPDQDPDENVYKFGALVIFE